MTTPISHNSYERQQQVKSQKMLAFMEAAALKVNRPSFALILLDDTAPQVLQAGESLGYPCFLRTCPESPRAGVLPSVRCNTAAALKRQFYRLRKLMREDDPDGCLMLMPYIPAETSSVAVLSTEDGFQGYISVGLGHNGVTAGNSFQIQLPLAPLRQYDENNNRTKQSRHMEEFVYRMTNMGADPAFHQLEFVHARRDASEQPQHQNPMKRPKDYLVQVRGISARQPPAVPPPEGVTIKGCVPINNGEFIVQRVYVSDGTESTAWLEENIREDTVPEGFVVVEPLGSDLGHVFAHCWGNGVPYIITNPDDVVVGDRWVEAASRWVVMDNDSKFEPKPYRPAEYIEQFMDGVEYANTHWHPSFGWFSTFFHQWIGTPYNDPRMTAYFAGIFAGWMPKAICALGMGEIRHAPGMTHSVTTLMGHTLRSAFTQDEWDDASGGPGNYSETDSLPDSRQHYYATLGSRRIEWSDMRRMLTFLRQNYRNTGWASSYGGKAWADCMAQGEEVLKILIKLMDKPTDKSLKDFATCINKCENLQHNGGFLFNKFLNKYAFDCGTGGFDIEAIGYTTIVMRLVRHVLGMEIERGCCSEVSDTGPLRVHPAPPPSNSWDELLTWVESMKKHNYDAMRNTEWWLDAPESVKDYNAFSGKWSHPGSHHDNKKPHNHLGTSTFIMCGRSDCGRCQEHIKELFGQKFSRQREVIANFNHHYMLKTTGGNMKLDVVLAGECDIKEDANPFAEALEACYYSEAEIIATLAFAHYYSDKLNIPSHWVNEHDENVKDFMLESNNDLLAEVENHIQECEALMVE